MFIWYFNEVILSEESSQKQGVCKNIKRGVAIKGRLSTEGRVQTFCKLWSLSFVYRQTDISKNQKPKQHHYFSGIVPIENKKNVNLENLSQIYFWIRKWMTKMSKPEVCLHFGSIFTSQLQAYFKIKLQIYFKYTSLLNSWWIQSIQVYKYFKFETYIYKFCSKLFYKYFHKVANLNY